MIGTEKSADVFQLIDIGKQRAFEELGKVNEILKYQEPTTIIAGTLAALLVVQYGVCILKRTIKYCKNFR